MSKGKYVDHVDLFLERRRWGWVWLPRVVRYRSVVDIGLIHYLMGPTKRLHRHLLTVHASTALTSDLHESRSRTPNQKKGLANRKDTKETVAGQITTKGSFVDQSLFQKDVREI